MRSVLPLDGAGNNLCSDAAMASAAASPAALVLGPLNVGRGHPTQVRPQLRLSRQVHPLPAPHEDDPFDVDPKHPRAYVQVLVRLDVRW